MVVNLRPIVAADWRSVHVWGGSEEACRFQVWGPNTPEQSAAFTAEAAAAWHAVPVMRRAYAAEIDEAVVGSGELHIRSLRHRQGEIQYIVNPQWWGRGVATEIGRALLAIAFDELRLHRVFATFDPRNVASGRVQSKLGMTVEGTLRHTFELADGWRDSTVSSILVEEWRRTGFTSPLLE